MVIGFISGLTRVGGGIFISPLLLFIGWAERRETAGISAAFIFVDSIAGLMGNIASFAKLPGIILIWAHAAVLGGIIGSEYGSKRFGSVTLKRLLAVILVIVALKILLT